MILRANTAPRNRRVTNSKRKRSRSQSILDVNIRAHAAANQRNRKIMKWLCVFILIGTVSAGIYLGAREALRRLVFENPQYRLTSLEVVTDGALTREQILQAAAIQEGTNIFKINLSHAQQNLNKLPRVEVAEITRTLPNRISIAITERKPVAWIAAKNTEDPSSDPSSFLVDRRGTLISGQNYLPEYLHLPIVYGIPTDNLEAGETVDTFELRAALELLRITSESPRIQICSIDLSKRYCMIVTDRSRARITFGLERLDEQLDRLAAVMDHVESAKQEIQTVNLMVQRNIPVTFASPTGTPEAVASADQPPVPAKTIPAKTAKADKIEKTKTPEVRKATAAIHGKPAMVNPSSLSASTHAKENRTLARKTPQHPSTANPKVMENMPVRRAIPVNATPDSSKHNG